MFLVALLCTVNTAHRFPLRSEESRKVLGAMLEYARDWAQVGRGRRITRCYCGGSSCGAWARQPAGRLLTISMR